MKRIMLTALIGLLSSTMMLDPQPLFADGCSNPVNDSALVHRLKHARPVTLDYQPGQSVMLAGDEAGEAELAGRSVVGIEFEPSGQMIGYGVETLPPVDVTPLLALGTNTVSLTAVDPQDMAWLRITLPCSASSQPTAEAPDSAAQPVTAPTVAPTATRVLLPTVTPTEAVASAIIAPTAEPRQTGKERPADTPANGAVQQALLRLLLLGLALGAGWWLRLWYLRHR